MSIQPLSLEPVAVPDAPTSASSDPDAAAFGQAVTAALTTALTGQPMPAADQKPGQLGAAGKSIQAGADATDEDAAPADQPDPADPAVSASGLATLPWPLAAVAVPAPVILSIVPTAAAADNAPDATSTTAVDATTVAVPIAATAQEPAVEESPQASPSVAPSTAQNPTAQNPTAQNPLSDASATAPTMAPSAAPTTAPTMGTTDQGGSSDADGGHGDSGAAPTAAADVATPHATGTHVPESTLPGLVLTGPTLPGSAIPGPASGLSPGPAPGVTPARVVDHVRAEITSLSAAGLSAAAPTTRRIVLRLNPESLGEVRIVIVAGTERLKVGLEATEVGRAALVPALADLHRELAGDDRSVQVSLSTHQGLDGRGAATDHGSRRHETSAEDAPLVPGRRAAARDAERTAPLAPLSPHALSSSSRSGTTAIDLHA